jgi:hypothetical protein
MCGEFAFQAKFDNTGNVAAAIKQRVEDFYIKLQLFSTGWLLFGTTKTGLVYQLKGNPPQAHE